MAKTMRMVLVGLGPSAGPMTNDGFTTRSMPCSLASRHASFSATVLAYAYHSWWDLQ